MTSISGKTLTKIIVLLAVPVSAGWLLMTSTTPQQVRGDASTPSEARARSENNAQLVRQLHRGADKHAVLPIRDLNKQTQQQKVER
jgi:hypothetical protein